MNIESLFSEALGIESPWKITGVAFNSERKRLDIKVDFIRGSTFEYKDESTEEAKHYKAYDTVEKTWRHMNFFEHECYIVARTPRVKTKDGKVKLISPPWNGHIGGFTMLFEALLLKMCANMPVNKVGDLFGIWDRKLWTLLERYVSKGLEQADHSHVDTIGIDETSIRKGHNYISLFVDLLQRKTIHISEGKSNKTVKDFVSAFERYNGKASEIKDVSCDMSPAFIKGITENLPNAKITFDKFHIVKLLNEAVDAVRRSEVPTQECLKGARYAILKNANNLTAKQRETRRNLTQKGLKTMRALHIRENFQDIYSAETYEDFELLLHQWYFWATHCRIEPIIKAAKTIKSHWEGILNWKLSQINNGILEGLNSVIQAAKRKARGYRCAHFKTMALLLTAKFDFKQINPYLPTRFS